MVNLSKQSSSKSSLAPDDPLELFRSGAPLGFEGNDANLYRYVGNEPTNATDPSGTWSVIKTGPKAILKYLGQKIIYDPRTSESSYYMVNRVDGNVIRIGTKGRSKAEQFGHLVHETIGGVFSNRFLGIGELHTGTHMLALIGELSAIAQESPRELTSAYAMDRYNEGKKAYPKTPWNKRLESLIKFICDCEQGKKEGETWSYTENTWKAGTFDKEELDMSFSVSCKSSKISKGTVLFVFRD